MFFKTHEIIFQLLLLITLTALSISAENFNLRVNENDRNNANRHAYIDRNQLTKVSLTSSDNVMLPRTRTEPDTNHMNFATEIYENNPAESVSPLNRGNLVHPVHAHHMMMPDRPRDAGRNAVHHHDPETTTLDRPETTYHTIPKSEKKKSPESLDERFGILETPPKCQGDYVLVGQRCRKMA